VEWEGPVPERQEKPVQCLDYAMLAEVCANLSVIADPSDNAMQTSLTVIGYQ
jgi:hypothetical protein